MSSFLKNKSGFTLIELLVVIAIIGILSAVVLASLNNARAKSRDTRRLSDLKQIQTALEMYYNDNGYYPQSNNAYTSSATCGGLASWCSLVTDLAPYISSIPGDPLGHQNDYRYFYDSDSGDNYQTYGMMIRLESSGNYSKAANDGGYSSYASNGAYYEVGQQPTYCMGKSPAQNWWGSPTTVCATDN